MTQPAQTKDDSPCVHICLMDYAQGLCIGCHRTLDEITYWTTYTVARKSEVLAAVAKRRAAAENNH
jgi:uncharacterized protein